MECVTVEAGVVFAWSTISLAVFSGEVRWTCAVVVLIVVVVIAMAAVETGFERVAECVREGAVDASC